MAFDPGAPRSYLTLAGAARAGVTPGDAGVVADGETSGIGERRFLPTWLAPFDSFKLGDEEVRHTRLRTAKLEIGDQADMVIGADFFMSHRVFVANSQHKLYFTYGGGPVFNLDATSPAAEAQAPAAK